MDDKVRKLYEQWLSAPVADADLAKELKEIKGNEEEIFDRFYKDLEFGTAGLRGVLGAGTNRMNIYTVARATRGYAKYLNTLSDVPAVAIAYDSRHKSDVFAKETARIMAENGIHVYIWPELMPTPSLSFAVRYYGCEGGVVITASHNPSKYNGYKAYDPTGCQIDEKAADAVLEYIQEEEMFPVSGDSYTFEQGLADGRIEYIPDEVRDEFITAASAWSLCKDGIDKSVKIAYTPLYGTGLRCVTTILERNGFANIVLVDEQAHPDGDFPTCPYPNPEIREAMEVGLKVAKEKGADILIATDPDADRIGIAVKDGDDFKLINGNQTGMLLLDWICKRRIELGNMPKDPLCVKSIVSTDMIYKIAGKYGVQVVDVLTGFKNIAPVVTKLCETGEEDRYIFGYEESYGYMLGTHVRDKCAVSASLMIAEMFAYYKGKNLSLLEVLDGIYKEFGYYINTTHSYEFPGASGFDKMKSIMESIRTSNISSFAGIPVVEVQDYINGYNGIPASNVMKYVLEDNGMVVLRPSGTEPKLKLYIGIGAKTIMEAEELEKSITEEVNIQ